MMRFFSVFVWVDCFWFYGFFFGFLLFWVFLLCKRANRHNNEIKTVLIEWDISDRLRFFFSLTAHPVLGVSLFWRYSLKLSLFSVSRRSFLGCFFFLLCDSANATVVLQSLNLDIWKAFNILHLLYNFFRNYK